MIFDLLLFFFMSAASAGEIPLRILVLELQAWRRARINHIRANETVPLSQIEEAIRDTVLALRSRN